MKRRILIVCRRSLNKCKSGPGLFDNSTNVRSVKIVLRSVKSQGVFWALVSGSPAYIHCISHLVDLNDISQSASSCDHFGHHGEWKYIFGDQCNAKGWLRINILRIQSLSQTN